jgi:predicted dinucleotide-utilizing enzyme
MKMAAEIPFDNNKCKVGIVGYGKLGKFLARSILSDGRCSSLELVFVWNRNFEAVRNDPIILPALYLEDLKEFSKFEVDLIVEVSHSSITKMYGASFLRHANYFVGSPTCFADLDLERLLRNEVLTLGKNSVLIPRGALWGAVDLQALADNGGLAHLSICMKKHPDSFSGLKGQPKQILEAAIADSAVGETTLFEGPVRDLCPLAPQNVNTMACCAMAGYSVGLDNTVAKLVSDPSLTAHVIEIDARGPVNEVTGEQFSVFCRRYNPSVPGILLLCILVVIF